MEKETVPMEKKERIVMNKTEPRTLPGFMELLPQDQILFNQIKETIFSRKETVPIRNNYVSKK